MLVMSPAPLAGLGDFTSDVVSTLGPFIGESRVRSFVTSLENKIRSEAEAGARQAIPDITTEVENTAKQAVMPYVIGAMIVGAIGGVLGGLALWRTRRK